MERRGPDVARLHRADLRRLRGEGAHALRALDQALGDRMEKAGEKAGERAGKAISKNIAKEVEARRVAREAEAVVRRCGPLDLPPEKYAAWARLARRCFA